MNKKSKLDLSNHTCPMIFVKTKIFLEQNSNYGEKIIIVRGKNNLKSLNNTLLSKNIKTKIKNLEKDKFQIQLF